MVGCGFLDRVFDINGVVGKVGFDVGVDAFLVEESEGGQFADGTHHIAAAVELSGAGVKLAKHHVVVGLRVARERHIANAGLFAFVEPDFEVDGVVFHLNLNGIGTEEQIAVVHVKRTDVKRGFAISQVAVEQLLIIYVAWLDTQHVVECFAAVFRVARPSDAAIVVSVAFVDDEIDAYVAVVDAIDRVAHDDGIAIAFRVVFVDDFFLVVLIVVFIKTRGLENARTVVVEEVFLDSGNSL